MRKETDGTFMNFGRWDYAHEIVKETAQINILLLEKIRAQLEIPNFEFL